MESVQSRRLVLMHNKVTEGQAKNDPLGLDVFERLPTWRKNSSSSANHLNHAFAPMSIRIVWLQKSKNYPQIFWFTDLLSMQAQEANTDWAPWKSTFNFWSITSLAHGPISGTPSGVDQDQLWASNECCTAKVQDTIEARDKLVDGLRYRMGRGINVHVLLLLPFHSPSLLAPSFTPLPWLFSRCYPSIHLVILLDKLVNALLTLCSLLKMSLFSIRVEGVALLLISAQELYYADP
jgi:hypothetical protein